MTHTPPVWLQNWLGRHNAALHNQLFRWCFRCDNVRWRRHRHQPLPAWVVLDLTEATAAEHRQRRDAP